MSPLCKNEVANYGDGIRTTLHGTQHKARENLKIYTTYRQAKRLTLHMLVKLEQGWRLWVVLNLISTYRDGKTGLGMQLNGTEECVSILIRKEYVVKLRINCNIGEDSLHL